MLAMPPQAVATVSKLRFIQHSRANRSLVAKRQAHRVVVEAGDKILVRAPDEVRPRYARHRESRQQLVGTSLIVHPLQCQPSVDRYGWRESGDPGQWIGCERRYRGRREAGQQVL